jgi:hypothetical protein
MMEKMSKKGVALIWALVTSTVILIITTTIATAVIKESQMSVRIDASTQAYALAKSGIDLGNACLEDKDCPPKDFAETKQLNTLEVPLTGAEEGEGLEGIINITITKNAADDFKIESTGTVNGVKRKLKHHAKEEVGTVLENPTILPKVTTKEKPTGTGENIVNTESYTQKFDFWMNSGGDDATVGLSDASGNNAIYTKYVVGSGFRVYVKNGTNTFYSDYINPTIDATKYGYRAEIKVIRDYAAQLRILEEMDVDSKQTFNCLGATYVSLKDTDINGIDLNTLYAPPSASWEDLVPGDDSEHIVKIGGLIIDNMTLYNTTTTPGPYINSFEGHMTSTKPGSASVTFTYSLSSPQKIKVVYSDLGTPLIRPASYSGPSIFYHIYSPPNDSDSATLGVCADDTCTSFLESRTAKDFYLP